MDVTPSPHQAGWRWGRSHPVAVAILIVAGGFILLFLFNDLIPSQRYGDGWRGVLIRTLDGMTGIVAIALGAVWGRTRRPVAPGAVIAGAAAFGLLLAGRVLGGRGVTVAWTIGAAVPVLLAVALFVWFAVLGRRAPR